MDEEKKNQVILVSVIIGLLILVAIFAIVTVSNIHKNQSNTMVKFKQIYSSDYDLAVFNSQYYMGLYDNKLNVIINKEGKEVYRLNYEINEPVIYEMKDGKTIICDYDDEQIKLYVFDGEKVELYDVISDISYGKPVFYEGKYLVAFVEIKENGFDLYDVSKKEVREITGYSLIGDMSYNYQDFCDRQGVGCILDADIISYAINNNSFIVMKEDSYCVIDFYGKEVVSCEYSNLLGVGDNTYIAQNSKGMYGLIKNNEVLLKFQYKVIANYDDYYLIVDKNNKMALFDKDLNNITGFKMKYDTLVEYNLRSSSNSIMLYLNNDNVFIINNYLEDQNKTEYENHDLYVFKDNELTKYEEYGVFVSKDVYLYDKDYNMIIYDSNMNELGKMKFEATKIQSIRNFNDYVYSIEYDNLDGVHNQRYFDYSGKELSDFQYGYPVFAKDSYIGYLSSDNVLSVILNDKVVGELKDSNIHVYGEQVLTKNSIYEIETS